MLSGSTEEPDNTNGSKSNHQHKKRFFWRQVEMRNLTYTLSPHSPFAALTDPLKKGVKGRSRTLGQPAHFNLTPEPEALMVDLLDIVRAVRFN